MWVNSNGVGIGSRQQVFGGDDWMIFFTSSAETAENSANDELPMKVSKLG